MTALLLPFEPALRGDLAPRRSPEPAMTSREVYLHFAGAFAGGSAAELEDTAKACGAIRGVLRTAVVHIDLAEVTELDRKALESLNRAWHLLNRRRWSVTITTPNAPDARAYFVRAAIRGDLAWASRS